MYTCIYITRMYAHTNRHNAYHISKVLKQNILETSWFKSLQTKHPLNVMVKSPQTKHPRNVMVCFHCVSVCVFTQA